MISWNETQPPRDLARGPLPIDAAPVRIPVAPALAIALLTGFACSEPSGGATGAPTTTAAASPLASWSRRAFSPASAGTHTTEPPVISSADPDALDDLIAAAPKAARRPTGADGGTLIGSDSGVPAQASASASAPPEVHRPPNVVVGAPTVQPGMPDTSIERASRAQLYWNLVQRCRDPQGKILPPDAIRLRFKIDVDGFIIPSSIIATAADPRFKPAADCMQRELSTAAFQAPAANRGSEGSVNATVPSVD